MALRSIWHYKGWQVNAETMKPCRIDKQMIHFCNDFSSFGSFNTWLYIWTWYRTVQFPRLKQKWCKGWMEECPKCYWVQKQIEPFCIHPLFNADRERRRILVGTSQPDILNCKPWSGYVLAFKDKLYQLLQSYKVWSA